MLAAALGMIVLDGTIVAVALPAIVADLNLDLTQAQWINSLYAVVFAALLLAAGWLGDRWGRRRMLLIGLVVFVLGSVLAALSASAGTLLLARAGRGVGGAMVLPATLSTVNATFRGPDRAAAFGLWGAVMSGAAAFGRLLTLGAAPISPSPSATGRRNPDSHLRGPVSGPDRCTWPGPLTSCAAVSNSRRCGHAYAGASWTSSRAPRAVSGPAR